MALWRSRDTAYRVSTAGVWLRRLGVGSGLALLAALYGWALQGVEFDLFSIFKYGGKFFELLGRMYPPDFSALPQLVRPLLQTLQMATLGTFFGALMALPLVVFGSQLIVRTALIYWPVRALMNVLRTIPDLLYAVLFVAAMGFGPAAGVGALSFFACAIIAKLTSESADNINPKPIEAVEAVGAGKLHVIRYAVLPQLFPAFIDHVIYVFELNVRVSAVMGYVGAGGMGMQLTTAMEWRNYPQVLTIALLIFALVIVIDLVANRIRDALVHGIGLPGPLRLLGIGAVVALIVWSFVSLEVDFARLARGVEYFRNLVWAIVTDPATEYFSLAVAAHGAVGPDRPHRHDDQLCVIVPFGVFGGRRHSGMPQSVAIGMKQIPNIIRAFPELILAIFFIATFGPGPLPGVLAIAIHSVGMLGKFNAEIVEKIRKEPVEALQATGASRLQVFRYAVLPQVLPEFLALFLYRFEINVRAASVLGSWGQGGSARSSMKHNRIGRGIL
jgi:phosphonate transport system permease protein